MAMAHDWRDLWVTHGRNTSDWRDPWDTHSHDTNNGAAAHAQHGVSLSAKQKRKHMAKPSMNMKEASLRGCYTLYVYMKRVLVRPLRTPKHVLIQWLKSSGSEESSNQLE
ncbi:hypothetical protein H8959_017384 [Pygathrix nigripes]